MREPRGPGRRGTTRGLVKPSTVRPCGIRHCVHRLLMPVSLVAGRQIMRHRRRRRWPHLIPLKMARVVPGRGHMPRIVSRLIRMDRSISRRQRLRSIVSGGIRLNRIVSRRRRLNHIVAGSLIRLSWSLILLVGPRSNLLIRNRMRNSIRRCLVSIPLMEHTAGLVRYIVWRALRPVPTKHCRNQKNFAGL